MIQAREETWVLVRCPWCGTPATQVEPPAKVRHLCKERSCRKLFEVRVDP